MLKSDFNIVAHFWAGQFCVKIIQAESIAQSKKITDRYPGEIYRSLFDKYETDGFSYCAELDAAGVCKYPREFWALTPSQIEILSKHPFFEYIEIDLSVSPNSTAPSQRNFSNG